MKNLRIAHLLSIPVLFLSLQGFAVAEEVKKDATSKDQPAAVAPYVPHTLIGTWQCSGTKLYATEKNDRTTDVNFSLDVYQVDNNTMRANRYDTVGKKNVKQHIIGLVEETTARMVEQNDDGIAEMRFKDDGSAVLRHLEPGKDSHVMLVDCLKKGSQAEKEFNARRDAAQTK